MSRMFLDHTIYYICIKLYMYTCVNGDDDRVSRQLFSFIDRSKILNYCCCLPTPMTLASGGSLMFPLVVHQPASPSIWPAVQSLRWGMSTNPGVTMGCS